MIGKLSAALARLPFPAYLPFWRARRASSEGSAVVTDVGNGGFKVIGPSERTDQLKGLLWIADAPLFIDDQLVEKVFDAVVRPKFEHQGQTETRGRDEETEFASTIEGTIGLKVPAWLTPVTPSLGLKAGKAEKGKEVERVSSVSQLKPIWNAERQLEELVRHYLVYHQDRLIVKDQPMAHRESLAGVPWYEAEQEFFTVWPRLLVFLDLPPRTKLIPTAAEFADGTVVLLYEDLVTRLTTEKGGPSRKYPDDEQKDFSELRNDRKAYWQSFENTFSSTKAMQVIESAAKEHGRIQWIDFRMPLSNNGSTLHLHIVPTGKADAGVFGYNFVRRAYKHGVRMVGTLKSEPDMNVLAIFDK